MGGKSERGRMVKWKGRRTEGERGRKRRQREMGERKGERKGE